jgi:hypothetical protein
MNNDSTEASPGGAKPDGAKRDGATMMHAKATFASLKRNG